MLIDLLIFFLLFFFSSRRRHTRWPRDWSSDVCSSDLEPTYREFIRETTFKQGTVLVEVKDESKDEKGVYKMYYDYNEAVRSIASHRVLALNRGEKEGVLRVVIEAPFEQIITYLQKKVIKSNGHPSSITILEEAIEDSYKRLIQPSIEREIRNGLSEKAEAQEIGRASCRERVYVREGEGAGKKRGVKIS